MTRSRRYPDPPWHTHGIGYFCPYLVRAAELELPPELTIVAKLGWTLGMLAYVEYRPPSPLTYSELIWMSAMTRSEAGSRGYFVARMYVDDVDTLAGGREIWALPKSLARFERRGAGVRVEAEDGTRVSLELASRGPAVPFHGRIQTLQPSERGVVRFRGDVSARMSPARLRVTELAGADPGWRGFAGARSLAGLAVRMDPFESVMGAPGLAGQRPAQSARVPPGG